MMASAANGFMNTSITDCSGTPFNFEPEYNTAAAEHQSLGSALDGINTEFEIGHFEPCTRSPAGERSSPAPSTTSTTTAATAPTRPTRRTTAETARSRTSPPAPRHGDTHGGQGAAEPGDGLRRVLRRHR